MNVDEYLKLSKSKPSKYKNIITEVDGIKFHSKKEAARYQVLKSLQACGEIRKLELQKKFIFEINGEPLRYQNCENASLNKKRKYIRKGREVCYVCDFYYERIDKTLCRWNVVIEDVKGVRTDMYRIKKALMWAVHKIKILET